MLSRKTINQIYSFKHSVNYCEYFEVTFNLSSSGGHGDTLYWYSADFLWHGPVYLGTLVTVGSNKTAV